MQYWWKLSETVSGNMFSRHRRDRFYRCCFEAFVTRIRPPFRPLLVALAGFGLAGWTALRPLARIDAHTYRVSELEAQIGGDLEPTVEKIDRFFQSRWADERIEPAERADELQVLRRLSLALWGAIPSLAEIREFEADLSPDRIRRWTVRLIADRRFAEYFADRLAVAFSGDFEQKVPTFSQARFAAWLSDRLAAGTPYDEIVRQMISEVGPPTTNGAANFITAELVQGDQFANRLAARSARAFLGQRIDCAECHDHPFDDWTQADFEGLAAYFSQVQTRAAGIEDEPGRAHEVEDRKTLEKRVVEPRVPFHPEWLGEHHSSRRRLAEWMTHRDNRRLRRAISNRVWGLLFGRPYVSPVDSIPDPVEPGQEEASQSRSEEDESDLLDLLADDLRDHGGDLRRLVLVIASSRVFQLSSAHPHNDSVSESERLSALWAVFPLTLLRPEQLGLSLEQAASLSALRAGESVVTRVRREQWMRRFIEQYGAFGENELDERTDSIPQVMHRMHGRITREKSRAEWTSAAGRIASLAPSDAECLETCYLVCLTPPEQEHFLASLKTAGARNRARVVEDIFWTLFNASEFGWSH
jgi:hypothetical protein